MGTAVYILAVLLLSPFLVNSAVTKREDSTCEQSTQDNVVSSEQLTFPEPSMDIGDPKFLNHTRLVIELAMQSIHRLKNYQERIKLEKLIETLKALVDEIDHVERQENMENLERERERSAENELDKQQLLKRAVLVPFSDSATKNVVLEENEEDVRQLKEITVTEQSMIQLEEEVHKVIEKVAEGKDESHEADEIEHGKENKLNVLDPLNPSYVDELKIPVDGENQPTKTAFSTEHTTKINPDNVNDDDELVRELQNQEAKVQNDMLVDQKGRTPDRSAIPRQIYPEIPEDYFIPAGHYGTVNVEKDNEKSAVL